MLWERLVAGKSVGNVDVVVGLMWWEEFMLTAGLMLWEELMWQEWLMSWEGMKL